MVRIVGWFGSLLVPTGGGCGPRRHFEPRRHQRTEGALTRGSHAAVTRLGVETGFSGMTASRFRCRLPCEGSKR